MPPSKDLMVTDTQTLHTNTHAHTCTFMLSAAVTLLAQLSMIQA